MIISSLDTDNIDFYSMAISPDHFVSEKEKKKKGYIKQACDYYANIE